jgi:hypothetical protein
MQLGMTKIQGNPFFVSEQPKDHIRSRRRLFLESFRRSPQTTMIHIRSTV